MGMKEALPWVEKGILSSNTRLSWLNWWPCDRVLDPWSWPRRLHTICVVGNMCSGESWQPCVGLAIGRLMSSVWATRYVCVVVDWNMC